LKDGKAESCFTLRNTPDHCRAACIIIDHIHDRFAGCIIFAGPFIKIADYYVQNNKKQVLSDGYSGILYF
jgi:hypothetical protein